MGTRLATLAILMLMAQGISCLHPAPNWDDMKWLQVISKSSLLLDAIKERDNNAAIKNIVDLVRELDHDTMKFIGLSENKIKVGTLTYWDGAVTTLGLTGFWDNHETTSYLANPEKLKSSIIFTRSYDFDPNDYPSEATEKSPSEMTCILAPIKTKADCDYSKQMIEKIRKSVLSAQENDCVVVIKQDHYCDNIAEFFSSYSTAKIKSTYTKSGDKVFYSAGETCFGFCRHPTQFMGEVTEEPAEPKSANNPDDTTVIKPAKPPQSAPSETLSSAHIEETAHKMWGRAKDTVSEAFKNVDRKPFQDLYQSASSTVKGYLKYFEADYADPEPTEEKLKDTLNKAGIEEETPFEKTLRNVMSHLYKLRIARVLASYCTQAFEITEAFGVGLSHKEFIALFVAAVAITVGVTLHMIPWQLKLGASIWVYYQSPTNYIPTLLLVGSSFIQILARKKNVSKRNTGKSERALNASTILFAAGLAGIALQAVPWIAGITLVMIGSVLFLYATYKHMTEHSMSSIATYTMAGSIVLTTTLIFIVVSQYGMIMQWYTCRGFLMHDKAYEACVQVTNENLLKEAYKLGTATVITEQGPGFSANALIMAIGMATITAAIFMPKLATNLGYMVAANAKQAIIMAKKSSPASSLAQMYGITNILTNTAEAEIIIPMAAALISYFVAGPQASLAMLSSIGLVVVFSYLCFVVLLKEEFRREGEAAANSMEMIITSTAAVPMIIGHVTQNRLQDTTMKYARVAVGIGVILMLASMLPLGVAVIVGVISGFYLAFHPEHIKYVVAASNVLTVVYISGPISGFLMTIIYYQFIDYSYLSTRSLRPLETVKEVPVGGG